MAKKLILVCKDKQTIEDVTKVLVASGQIHAEEIEGWEEKTWEVKCKTGPVNSKMLIVGDIKDTEHLACFIDIFYERWGILYGTNPRYALITTEITYIKDSNRYKAFLEEYNNAVGSIFNPPATDSSSKMGKTLGTVGLAVATGGVSYAAQIVYDNNKNIDEKFRQLSVYGTWHFAKNRLGEFLVE